MNRARMGNEGSKSRLSDHVALPNSSNPTPNIIITRPSQVDCLESPKPRAPPPTPLDGSYYCTDSPVPNEPPSTPHNSVYDLDPRETMVLAGTPPPDRPPPPPPDEPLHNGNGSYFGESTIIQSDEGSNPPPLPPMPAPRTGFPVIKRNIIYAKVVATEFKDRMNQFDALNTTNRPKSKQSEETHQMKDYFARRDSSLNYDEYPIYNPITDYTFKSGMTFQQGAYPIDASNYDEYPIYNPITDYTFKSGMTFQQGAYPIDATRINIGFVGRQGAGKSTLINAIRGLTMSDPQAAGRHPCNHMEPFRFMEEEFQNMILWEIPYPRAFASVSDIYDRNMGFDRFYERTHLTMLSTKSDDDLDAEAREFGRSIDSTLKREYDARARSVFTKSLMMKAQILTSVELLLISSPVVKNLLSGTIGYLHYKLDEDKLLELLELGPGCHYTLENKLRKSRDADNVRRPTALDRSIEDIAVMTERTRDTSSMFPPRHIQKSTVLADAGFEIMFGTDDRVFGNLEPKSTVRRAGRTAFNYGFIGGHGVGKSAMINAMRGMSSKHPLAAGKSRIKRGTCERFEFDDDLLKYSVTLWELHYPKKISAIF
ncbi:hypothetical protein COOONC_02963 [Cooperia oncophora]